MKAVVATVEELEADGSCELQQLFATDPPAKNTSTAVTASIVETGSTGHVHTLIEHVTLNHN